MIRSQGSSNGVLGPVGLLLIGVLWVMTVSGTFSVGRPSAPAAGMPDSTPVTEQADIKVKPPTNAGPLHTGLTASPTSLPTTGTGV